MKKIVAVLIALFIMITLAAGFTSWDRYQINKSLAEAAQELTATKTALNAANETLDSKEKMLTATKEMLAETEIRLTTTEKAFKTAIETSIANYELLSKTKEMLSAAKQEVLVADYELMISRDGIKSLQTAISSVKKELAAAQKEKAELKNRLINIEPTLSLPSPKYKGAMEYSLAYSILRERFPNAQILIRNGVKLVSLRDWKKFIAADEIDGMKYSMPDFNCTDYAKILAGRARAWAPASAFGIVVVRRTGIDQENYTHYMNFFLDEYGNVWLVEPQNDAIFDPPENWQYLLILQ